MVRILSLSWVWVLVLFLGLAGAQMVMAQNEGQPPTELRQRAEQLSQQGNWQDALNIYDKLLVDKRSTGGEAAKDLEKAFQCMQQLGLIEQLDPLIVKSLVLWGEDWRFLAQAARTILQAPHQGQLDGEVFIRSPRQSRNLSPWKTTNEQDRQQALKWLEKALKLCGELDGQVAEGNRGSAAERGEIWTDMLTTLLQDRSHKLGWRLQIKTDIDGKIDYSDDVQPWALPQRDAPVDEDGKPVFHQLPASWAEATSDGQRCRWAVQRAQGVDHAASAATALRHWASFLQSQFEVDTLREQMWIWNMQAARNRGQSQGDATTDEQSGGDQKFADQMAALLEVHTLTDDETIAKLASGIQRFKLPEDQNPLRMLKTIVDTHVGESLRDSHTWAQQTLVSTYLNRRQHPKAAQVLKAALAKADEHKLTAEERSALQSRLDDIVLARGKFESMPPQTVGSPVKFDFSFRNAKTVSFTARRLDYEKLLTKLKAEARRKTDAYALMYVMDNPSALIELGIDEYLSAPAANWKVDLQPSENHWDKRIEVTAPIEKGGLYVVEATLDGGVHRARCSLWVNDLSIVYKPVEKEHWFYVADAVTGAPMSNLTVEFIGIGPKFTNVARKTNAEGQVRYSNNAGRNSQTEEPNTWIAVARDDKGRMAISSPQAFYDLAGMGDNEERPYSYKAYGVVEQPIYRPDNKVRAKLWLGEADYARAQPVKNQSIQMTVIDPRGKEFWKRMVTTDGFGGAELEFDLPAAATLGIYQITAHEPKTRLHYETNMRFRVEEFRKPEFEVNIEAPEKSVTLGETVEAKIRAKYYFGTPVTDATVHVKVTRSAFVDDWYPVRPFDWCYGRGYWWSAYTYDWYPSWERWQECFPVAPPWRPWGEEPPEIVSDQEVKLDAEGVATIRIDTALAAKFQGKQDHRYEISVEVRDASRRTITANGSVVAARQPFKIYTWLHRGFYRVGDTVEANFMAQTLNRQPVAASGRLDLLRVTYDAERQPQETVVESWDARTDDQGNFAQKLVVRRGGQYRLRLTLKDEAGHEVEGAYVFTVRGDNQTADNFRFSELELITDKPEYAPGDSVELQINADRADANVLVFIRPKANVASAPRMVKLVNKTAKLTIEVSDGDQPNFFVEAFTIYNGKFYQSVREVFVPPAKRALDVKVTADKKEYLPGEKAKLAIEVKDLTGKPVQGNVLVSVYDRSLEQIAGDALPPDIREFFWKWRRSYYPTTDHSLKRPLVPIYIQDVPWMSQLGLFDEILNQAGGGGMGGNVRQSVRPSTRAGGMMRGFGGGMGGATLEMAMAPQAASADMDLAKSAGGGAAEVAPTQVRQEFADSALWLTNINCDRNGRAQAEFAMPENLTDWQMRVWSVGSNLNVGSGAATAVTHKNILIRLAAPRFLTERDQVVLSAIVHNDFDVAHDVQVRLEIDGGTQLDFASNAQAKQTVRIEAHQQKRVDWTCSALAEGEVTLRAFAEAAAQSDAMQIKLPIIVNGTLKTDSWAGTVRPEQTVGRMKVTIPKERRQEQSRLTVRVSPSLASAIVDALPYLATYPHGCTEQTLNRFLPTVLTQRMLIDMKVDLKKVKTNRQNLNAQQLGDPATRAADWKRFDSDAVFDNEEVAKMVESGVQRLTDMQNGDGGWGWFYENSSPHTTATVVRGLIVARDAGAAIVPDVIERGLGWLESHQAQRLEQNVTKRFVGPTDALVFHTLVMAGRSNEAMQKLLYEKRNELGVYGKVLLALATHKLGNAEQTAMLRQNVEQFLVQDAENETAFIRDQSPWWYWYGSSFEATAHYLKLLTIVDAKNPTAARLVKYLLNNRKAGRHWDSTRDTALIVEAFTDYLKATGENKSQVSGEVLLGGKRLGTFRFTPETLFTANNTIEITGNAVPAGEHELEIRKASSGPLYYSVYSTNFTLEEEIAPAGLEVKIERRYYRLDPTQKRLDLAGDRGQTREALKAAYDRTLIEDLQAVAPGTLVEVELKITSKNDYEYLLIEERKAAGLEAVDTQSGSIWGQGFYAYRELRDKQLSFYIDRLPRGEHLLSYQLRAESPGSFTALPAIISGMYAPELVGNSSDKDIAVKD